MLKAYMQHKFHLEVHVNIPDKILRVKCILQEYHRQVCPILDNQQPELNTRKIDN